MKYFLHKSQVDYFTKHLGPDWVEDHCIIIEDLMEGHEERRKNLIERFNKDPELKKFIRGEDVEGSYTTTVKIGDRSYDRH